MFNTIVRLDLGEGRIALLDAADAPLAAGGSWSAVWSQRARTFYVRGKALVGDRHRMIHLHRLITVAAPGGVVHHENHDGLDNRRCNLVVCTYGQNNAHRIKSRGKSSRFKGVYLCRRTGRWRAYIDLAGKR